MAASSRWRCCTRKMSSECLEAFLSLTQAGISLSTFGILSSIQRRQRNGLGSIHMFHLKRFLNWRIPSGTYELRSTGMQHISSTAVLPEDSTHKVTPAFLPHLNSCLTPSIELGRLSSCGSTMQIIDSLQKPREVQRDGGRLTKGGAVEQRKLNCQSLSCPCPLVPGSAPRHSAVSSLMYLSVSGEHPSLGTTPCPSPQLHASVLSIFDHSCAQNLFLS